MLSTEEWSTHPHDRVKCVYAELAPGHGSDLCAYAKNAVKVITLHFTTTASHDEEDGNTCRIKEITRHFPLKYDALQAQLSMMSPETSVDISDAF